MLDFLRFPSRGFGFFSIAFLLLHLTSQPVMAQQVTQEWERRYDSAIPTFETSSFSAVDAAGNTYIAGNSKTSTQGSPTNHDGYVIAKFSPTGEVLWQHRFPFVFYPHAVVDVALDETGFYVVVSTVEMGSRTMVNVIKYDLEDGQQIWYQSETPALTMRGVELKADKRGGVLLVGSVSLNGTDDYAILYKYDASTGDRLWRQDLSRSDLSYAYDNLAGFTLDNQGDIYLTGSSGSLNNASQMLTTKRSGADGSLLWQMQHDTPQQDRAMQLAVDDTGVYTWGIHYTTDPEQPTANTLLKYDATTGRQVWSRRMEGGAIPEQLVADKTGGLYLRSSLQGQNRLARRSASSGSQRWSTSFAGIGTDMVADAAGNLYLGNHQNDTAYTVRRYNARRGNVAWTYTSASDSTYLLRELALSEAGTLHVSGTTGNEASHLFATSLQTATGAPVYNLTFRHTFSGVDVPTNVTTDAAGNVYIAATRRGGDPSSSRRYVIIFKYSPEGQLLWSQQHDGYLPTEGQHLVVDAAGAVYVMREASGDSNTGPAVALLKLDSATGEPIWETTHSPTESNVGREVKLDWQGNLYMMGMARYTPTVPTEHFIVKVDAATGEAIWTNRYSPYLGDTEQYELVAFALDKAGDVYVTGNMPAPGVANNLVLARYAGTNGNLVWLEEYNSMNRQTVHRASGVAVDTVGGIYVAAFDDLSTDERVSYLLKFSAESGAFVWRQPMIDQGTTPGRLDNLQVDNAGGAYVTSFINGSPHVIKFSTEEPGIVWAAPFQGVLSGFELDQKGGIYAMAWNTDGVHTIKFRASDGARVWQEVKPELSDYGLLALDNDRNIFVVGSAYSPDTNLDILTVKYTQTSEEPSCAIPVNVQLYLAPYAIRAGWEARTTADFSPHILNEDTGLRWTWGDGSEPTMSYTAFGTSRITGKHTYTQAGIFQVGLDFSESCLEAANSDYNQWHVIYDPEAGHVKGSGSISLTNLELGGITLNQKIDAEFSFSVRYQNKHATKPQGTVQLSVNNQKYSQSGALDWLVITGNQAIWKGTAQLQGVGLYGYIVSVRDAGGTGKNDPNDQLRIRIWDMDRGNAVVFDNFEAGGDIYDLRNETGPRIGWGNIVINGKKSNEDLYADRNDGAAGMAASLQVYPNPAVSEATLRFTLQQEGAYEVSLYDLKGALVQELKQGRALADEQTEVQINVAALPKGVYLVRLSSDAQQESVRLVLTQ